MIKQFYRIDKKAINENNKRIERIFSRFNGDLKNLIISCVITDEKDIVYSKIDIEIANIKKYFVLKKIKVLNKFSKNLVPT